MKERDFQENKKTALKKLEKAKKDNLVDEGITPIIDIINEFDDYFTSSSCFGRIVLLQLPVIGDKKNAEFIGKWHRQINADEVLSAVEKAETGQLWLLAQSSIIHIVAKTNTAADKILKIAYSCGFKHSGFKSIENKIVVEICSTERLDAPVGMDGKLFCDQQYLDLLVDISNEIIKKSNAKLEKFEQELRKYLSTHKTTI